MLELFFLILMISQIIQPFRYRGYVYDVETGLYYLRSRYYKPEITARKNDRILIVTTS